MKIYTGSQCNELFGCLIPCPFPLSAEVLGTLPTGSVLLVLEMEARKSVPHRWSFSESEFLFVLRKLALALSIGSSPHLVHAYSAPLNFKSPG